MQVYLAGIQDISSIDYPEHICSVIFFQGCNLRCRFCYNSAELGFKKKSSLDSILPVPSFPLVIISHRQFF